MITSLSKEWREWFDLLKSDSLPICPFHLAFTLFMPKTKEQITPSVFTKRASRTIHYLTLFKKEQGERFAPPLFTKRASITIHYLTLFTKRARRAFRSIGLYKKERIAVSLFCSQKTSDLHEKPKSEFLTLKVAKYLWGVSFMDCSRKMLQTFLITCLLIYIKY